MFMWKLALPHELHFVLVAHCKYAMASQFVLGTLVSGQVLKTHDSVYDIVTLAVDLEPFLFPHAFSLFWSSCPCKYDTTAV